jgi:hypothetical protein
VALQPVIAGNPETQPIYPELFTFIDRACPHWLLPAPNHRLLVTMLWQAMPWVRDARKA